MDEWLTFIERLPHSWRRVPCAFRINLHLNVLTLQTESRGLERLNYFSGVRKRGPGAGARLCLSPLTVAPQVWAGDPGPSVEGLKRQVQRSGRSRRFSSHLTLR